MFIKQKLVLLLKKMLVRFSIIESWKERICHCNTFLGTRMVTLSRKMILQVEGQEN